MALGLLLLAVWTHHQLESWSFQRAATRQLEAVLRASEFGPYATAMGRTAFEEPAFAAAGHATEVDGVLGRLEIPRLRITAVVAEGVDEKTLGHAVGHIPSTAMPGAPGNCGLAGHRDTFLRGLGGVRLDDVIRFVTPERTYTYEVDWSMVVEPDRIDTLDSTATPSITLVTCFPFAFMGRAPQRFVVRARQVEAVALPAALQERDAIARARPAEAR